MTDHLKDKAVVPIADAITPQSVAEAIGAVRHARDHCFHDWIELAISSPGGDVLATERLMEFLDDLRREGVRIDTAASGMTASAAASLLSLGDRRRASANCQLQYHLTWQQASGPVTAASAQGAAATLDETDARFLSRLAARGMDAAAGARGRPAAAEDFRPGDWNVIGGIVVALASWRAEEIHDRQALLERLREHLDGRHLNVLTLERIYRTLFTLDRAISPALARELLLIDGIGNGRDGARCPTGPSLRVPEWGSIWPEGRVDLQHLRRHTLILGETGSGKTASGVMPLLRSMLAPDSGVGCALVIDPKRELLAAARALGPDVRLIKAGAQGRPGSVLNVMASPEWALRGDLEAGRPQDAARKILFRSATLATETPARIWSGLATADSHTAYWQQEGGTLAASALSLALAVTHLRGRIFAGADSPPSILSAPPALRRALSEFGEAAGFLPAQGGLGEALESALDEVQAQRKETGGQRREERHAEVRKLLTSKADSVRAQFRQSLGELLDDPLELPLDLSVERCLDDVGTAICRQRDAADAGDAIRPAEWAVLRRAVEGTAIHGGDAVFRRRFEALSPSPDGPSVEWPPAEAAARIGLSAFTACEPDCVRPSPNMMALAQLALDLFLTPTFADGDDWPPSKPGDDEFPSLAERRAARRTLLGAHLAEALKPLWGPEADPVWRGVMRWETLAKSGSDNVSGHYASILSIAQQAFREFAETPSAWTLYFGVEPCWEGLANGSVEPVDFVDAVDADRGRRVWVVQPKLAGERGILLAKSIKAAFFEAVLGNEDRANGRSKPLVGYVADEFHRFVTSEDAHGEQSFLDTCRSFGAFCALASQSIASIQHALAVMGGSGEQNEAAVSILLNNVGTKLFFRTTDEGTIQRIRALCPWQPGRPRVVDVRPPSTLAPGECYAALPDGRFERRQLAPCLPAAIAAQAGTDVPNPPAHAGCGASGVTTNGTAPDR